MSGPVITPKVIVKGAAYEALPAPDDSCAGCAGHGFNHRSLCYALPCFPSDSPLGVHTIYQKVAE